jgi:hypothetical protein
LKENTCNNGALSAARRNERFFEADSADSADNADRADIAQRFALYSRLIGLGSYRVSARDGRDRNGFVPHGVLPICICPRPPQKV